MANDRGPRLTRLLVFWLIVCGARVQLDTVWNQDTREHVPNPSTGASTPGSAGERSFPLFFFLAGREQSQFLLSAATLKVRRRRGSGAPASEHQPPTSLRPPSRYHCDWRPTTPIISTGHFLAHSLSTREIFAAVQGTGAYLALIYLRTIETNPGPTGSPALNHALQKALESISAEIASLKADMSGEIKLLRVNICRRLDQQEKEVNELRKENVNLHHRVSQLERHSRRKNVVIFGVPNEVNVSSDTLPTFVQDKLGLGRAPLVASAHRIGKHGDKRPVLAKFCTEQDKALVMSNVSNLKGTKISINDDLTPEEQAVRRTIVEALKLAKSKGIENCKVRRTGLLINGHLVPAGELCDSSWVENLAWYTSNQPGENAQRRNPCDKRSYDEIRSPPFAAVAAGNAFFPTARSNQQSTASTPAGNRGRGRGRGQGGKKSKTN
jgi:hypothetical protein